MNRGEKEKLVLELYKQDKTIREIAKIVHMSFGDISFIIRRETGEADEQERTNIIRWYLLSLAAHSAILLGFSPNLHR